MLAIAITSSAQYSNHNLLIWLGRRVAGQRLYPANRLGVARAKCEKIDIAVKRTKYTDDPSSRRLSKQFRH
jgi:hypothetical protein